jgi:hypothetical protein
MTDTYRSGNVDVDAVAGGSRADEDSPYSIQHDDFFITVRIRTDSIAGVLLFLSISANSIVLYAGPNKPALHDGDDMATDRLRVITIPTEIEPEHADVSFLDDQLVLVLPVATPIHQRVHVS